MYEATRQTAELAITTRPFALKAKVDVTALGLIAIGTLVTGILLSTAVIVRAAQRRK